MFLCFYTWNVALVALSRFSFLWNVSCCFIPPARDGLVVANSSSSSTAHKVRDIVWVVYITWSYALYWSTVRMRRLFLYVDYSLLIFIWKEGGSLYKLVAVSWKTGQSEGTSALLVGYYWMLEGLGGCSRGGQVCSLVYHHLSRIFINIDESWTPVLNFLKLPFQIHSKFFLIYYWHPVVWNFNTG